MSNMKKIIQITLILIIATMTIMLSTGKVQAAREGSQYTIGYKNKEKNTYDLYHSDWLYCIDHAGALSSWKTNLYTVYYTINIRGNEAKRKTTGETVYRKENAAIAYILGAGTYRHGYNGKSTRQYAMWAYWNTWLKKVGTQFKGITYASWKNRNQVAQNNLTKKAIEYSESFTNKETGACYIDGDKSVKLEGGVIEYTPEFSGKVKRITITYNSNVDGEVKEGLHKVFGGDKNKGNSKNFGLYSDKECTKKLNAKKIKSGETFYIKCEESVNYTLTNMKIEVERKPSNIYIAEISLMRSSSGKQRLIGTNCGEEAIPYHAEIEVDLVDKGGQLLLKKSGGQINSDGDVSITEKKLPKVEFKLFKEGTGWVYGAADQKKTYKSLDDGGSFATATTYKTETDGKTPVIQFLDKGTYYVYESSIGDNDDYDKKIIKATETTDDGKEKDLTIEDVVFEEIDSENKENKEDAKTYSKITIKIQNKKRVTVEMVDQIKYGSMRIEKRGDKLFEDPQADNEEVQEDQNLENQIQENVPTDSEIDDEDSEILNEAEDNTGEDISSSDQNETEGDVTDDIEQEEDENAKQWVNLSDTKIKVYLEQGEDGTTGWVTSSDGTENGDMTYVQGAPSVNGDPSQGVGTMFSTDTEGLRKINNLKYGSYRVYEVESSSEEWYALDQQKNYRVDEISSTYNYVYLGSITVNDTSTMDEPAELIAYNDKSVEDLLIEKSDETYKDLKLGGARFKIYAETKGAWVTWNSQEGKYEYKPETTAENAKEFITKNDGTRLIKNLQFGVYKIYETKAPQGYDITKQVGYGADSNYPNWVKLNDVEIKQDFEREEPVKYELTNRKIVKLEGIVWQDNPATKANGYNSIYNSTDYKEEGSSETIPKDNILNGITVNLRNIQNNNLIASTTTNNGYYVFEKIGESEIYYWDLVNAYVEFIYDNKEFVTVDPFVGNNVSINSKAQEYEMTKDLLDDNKLTGTDVEKGLPGRAITNRTAKAWNYQDILKNNDEILRAKQEGTISKENLQTAPLTAYYDKEEYKVKDINLGLMAKIKPSYDVGETIAYIKVKMKGYTYTYQYGGTSATVSTQVPTVFEQTHLGDNFTLPLYPSDIAYNSEHRDDDDRLKVYVVYRINIKNTVETDRPNLYYEEKLFITSLTNSYDSERYQIEEDGDNNYNRLWNKNSITKNNENGTETITYDVKSDDEFKNGIEYGEVKTTFISFRVKDEALLNMLNKDISNSALEKVPTKAETNGYHEYLRTDNVWKHNDNRAFDGYSGSSYPETDSTGDKYYIHKSNEMIKDAQSLYLRLELGESRTISGTVFEDTKIKDDEVLGNGMLDENEKNKASEVTVELLTNKDATEPTELYKTERVSETRVDFEESEPAIKKTSENGTYTFEGVVPGYYYIRFTYGDGSQMIVQNDRPNEISPKDYKSTIINTTANGEDKEIMKNAMEATSENLSSAQQTLINDSSNVSARKLVEWYKYLNSDKYSTAIDDIAKRESIKDYEYRDDGKVYDTNGNVVNITDMSAYTPMIGISIENDQNDINDEQLQEGRIVYKAEQKAYFGGFNFGLIQTSLDVGVGMKMTNVQFTTQTSTVLVSANPTDRTAPYLTALDQITGGSKNAKLEIEPDKIYGSEVQTTYELTLTNNSIADYVEENGEYFGDYFKYGDKSHAELKRITVKEILDKLDPKYDKILSINNIKATTYDHEGNVESDDTPIQINTRDTENANNLTIEGWDSIQNTGGSTKVTFTTTALLGPSEDTLFENEVKVTKIGLDNLTTLNTGFEWRQDNARLTVMPDTGSDRSVTYWIAGTIALIVLGAGFILLKKRVLK